MRLLKLQKILLFIPFANILIFFIFGINQIINFFTFRLPIIKSTVVYALAMVSILASHHIISKVMFDVLPQIHIVSNLLFIYFIGIAMGFICILAGKIIGKLIEEKH